MANSTSLSYEQVDWNKEVQDQDDVLKASDTESGDFAQSDGTNWIPKSVSEMKTLLGVPNKVYRAKLYITDVEGGSGRELTITEYQDDFDGDIAPSVAASGNVVINFGLSGATGYTLADMHVSANVFIDNSLGQYVASTNQYNIAKTDDWILYYRNASGTQIDFPSWSGSVEIELKVEAYD